MFKKQEQYFYSPSDLIRFMESPFASWMDRFSAECVGPSPEKDSPDPLMDVLAEKGIIQESELHQYGSEGSYLEEHPSPFQDGIEAASGSLGHGLPIANGMALSSKISNLNFSIFEVPISYNGRGYDEGKKIGIHDAFRVFSVILKYKFFKKFK